MYLGVSAWAKTDAGISVIVSTFVVSGGLFGVWDNRIGMKHQHNEIQSTIGTKVENIGSRLENIEQQIRVLSNRSGVFIQRLVKAIRL